MDRTLFLSSFALLFVVHRARATINCYTCSSRNNSNRDCQDPFNPAMSTYETNCMVPKGGHIGKFPANFCVKVSGITEDTGEELVIRACTLRNMENQCGSFRYENEKLKGCILTCNEDGCNSAKSAFPVSLPAILLIIILARILH